MWILVVTFARMLELGPFTLGDLGPFPSEAACLDAREELIQADPDLHAICYEEGIE